MTRAAWSRRVVQLRPEKKRLSDRLDNLWWFWLLVLALPALWPFYSEGLTRSFDGGLHLLRLSLLNDYVQQGIFLPRWTPSLILGYGYPLYNFYAPGAYYLAEALHLLGMSLYHAFCGAFVIQILGAGYGLYFLARDLFSAEEAPSRAGNYRGRATSIPALIAAVAYVYTPYLLTNVYIRGAIAEAGAQALLPWIFWSMRRLVRAEQPDPYFFPATFTLAALALTHNITLLFLPPILLLFLLLQWLAAGALWQRLLWIGGALLSAMGLSAFFWLPLLLERHDLADTAYLISRSVWLPGSVWTWQNFLDWGLHYTHSFARPIRISVVQLSLATFGFLAALRWAHQRNDRMVEWIFWLLVTVGVGAMMGSWALPLWLSNDILPVAQFTWRLLAILSLPLALFVGGLPFLLPEKEQSLWRQGAGFAFSAILLAAIILTQRPILAWMDVYAAETATTTQAVFAQIEVDKGVISGGHRNSSIQEFRPRWADTDLILTDDFTAPEAPPVVTVTAANDFALQLAVEAPTPTFVRFATFYFPGWLVTLDGTPQPTYPSTNLGLLTVNIPAGSHTVSVVWSGTPVRRAAGFISLLTLLGLSVLCWRSRPLHRGYLLPLLVLSFVSLWSLFGQPWYAAQAMDRVAAAIVQPETAVQTPGITLRGLRLAETEAGYLTIYPYWQVQARQPAALAMRWQLYDAQGALVSECESYPYYNTIRADSWAPGTLIDDVQRLPLPPTLAPGSYTLRLQLFGDETIRTEPMTVAEYHLDHAPAPAVQPAQRVDLRYGDQLQLVGYTARADGQVLVADEGRVPIVRAGQYLRYTLFWQADGLVDQNYHAFVHLTDHAGQPLVQEDQLPGPLFHAPQLWNGYRANADSYLLRIPRDAPSGLYWPGVGVYNFATLDRLPLADDSSDADRYFLAPIKLLGTPTIPPLSTSNARFGDMATLLGYTGSAATTVLRRGDTLPLTLYWQSERTTTTDYTRFVQVYDPERGMAAQFDSPPQDGANPTSTWVVGEVVEDKVVLTVNADPSPGRYGIYVGFYNPADGVRLPVWDAEGTAVPDGWSKVGEVVVE